MVTMGDLLMGVCIELGMTVLVVWKYRRSSVGCLALSISSIEDLLSDVGCYCWVGLIMHGFR